MKRIVANILCIGLLFPVWGDLYGQSGSLRLGFQASPVFSSIKSNDDLIVKNGGNFGLKLGATGDIYFKDNFSFTLGLNLGFHQGGEFLYEIGGNYLPESDLSDPLLQMGDKPLPDGVKIGYNLQYLEVPVGFKITTNERGYSKYFIEAPVLTFSFLTSARGDIQAPNIAKDQENIKKDLSFINIFFGLGAGVEHAISENNSLIGGIYLHKGLFDFTRDKGHRAIENPDEDPNDPNDDYLKQTENSRSTVSNVTIKIGILF